MLPTVLGDAITIKNYKQSSNVISYILAIEKSPNFEVLLLGAIASSSPAPTRFDVRSGIGEKEVSSLGCLNNIFGKRKTTL